MNASGWNITGNISDCRFQFEGKNPHTSGGMRPCLPISHREVIWREETPAAQRNFNLKSEI